MQHYQRIRDLREDSDLTQEALAKQLHMHKTTYTNYEQGKHTVPLDFAVTLADFYSVSLDYLAGRSNFPQGAANPVLLPDEMRLLERFLTSRIVYNMLDEQAWTENLNEDDPAILETLRLFKAGNAFPQAPGQKNEKRVKKVAQAYNYRDTHKVVSFIARC